MPNLMDVELDLLSALESLDGLSDEEEIPEATQALICGYMDAAVEKRDRVAWFLNSMEDRANAMNAEATKLHEKAERLERARDRFASFVLMVMQRTGTKKLEGKTYALSVQQNPARVEVSGDVPAEYLLPQKPAPVPGPDKRKIKAALEAGEQVPNSRIVPGDYRLVVR